MHLSRYIVLFAYFDTLVLESSWNIDATCLNHVNNRFHIYRVFFSFFLLLLLFNLSLDSTLSVILVPFHEYHFRISTERSCYRNKNLFLLHEFRKLGVKFEETILLLPLSVTKFPNKKEMGRRFEHIRFLNQRVSKRKYLEEGFTRAWCRSVSPSSSSSFSSNSVRSAFSDRLNPETSPRIKGSQGLKGTEEEEEEEGERLRERVDWAVIENSACGGISI